jgi:diguanylate cyclase (GGDEF)-like protein
MQVKSILESVFRETDYLVRWGGEEFLVVARFTDRRKAPELAERLRKKVENHDFEIGKKHPLSKTCSIGYACFPFLTNKPNSLDWEHVVDIADHCLYAAKNSNRNAWVGLENLNSTEEDIFLKITKQTQNLIDLKQLEVRSSITDKSLLKWD